MFSESRRARCRPGRWGSILLVGALVACGPLTVNSSERSSFIAEASVLESPAESESPDEPPDLATTNTCEDPSAGYRVVYPGNWSTNQGSGGVPACRAFSDVGVFDLPDEVPTYVRVFILLQSGDQPSAPSGTFSERQLTVDGQQAVRWEITDPEEPDNAPVTRVLYVVDLPAAGSGDAYLLASTTTELIGDYDANVVALDWMMERLEFLPDEN